jgi:hypothetical protein
MPMPTDINGNQSAHQPEIRMAFNITKEDPPAQAPMLLMRVPFVLIINEAA